MLNGGGGVSPSSTVKMRADHWSKTTCPENRSALPPISKIESLDFCAISESESNVAPFKFVCKHSVCFESHLFFLSFAGIIELKKGIFK